MMPGRCFTLSNDGYELHINHCYASPVIGRHIKVGGFFPSSLFESSPNTLNRQSYPNLFDHLTLAICSSLSLLFLPLPPRLWASSKLPSALLTMLNSLVVRPSRPVNATDTLTSPASNSRCFLDYYLYSI